MGLGWTHMKPLGIGGLIEGKGTFRVRFGSLGRGRDIYCKGLEWGGCSCSRDLREARAFGDEGWEWMRFGRVESRGHLDTGGGGEGLGWGCGMRGIWWWAG